MLRRLIDRNRKATKRLNEAIEILRNSNLLDPVWYRQTYADLRDTPVDVARHYLEYGAKEGRNPHPLFDTNFYLEQNPDVAASGINPLVHYIIHGGKERRNPHPLHHTKVDGMSLILQDLPDDFNEEIYLRHHPDVAEAVANQDFESGASHWLLCGRQEGRVYLPILPAQIALNPKRSENGFQSAAYAACYPDVHAHLGNDPDRLLEHWQMFGYKEGRIPFGYLPYRNRSSGLDFWARSDAITYYGFFDAKSGLGAAARGYRAALEEAGYIVSSVTISEKEGAFETNPNVRIGSGEHGAGKRNKVNIFHLNADMVHKFFYNGRLHLLDESFNIGIWAWELSYFRPEWASAFGALDEIWVPSEFCRAAISAISPVPVVTIPHVVEVAQYEHLLSRSYFRISDDVFVFSCIFDVGSVVDRKNPEAVIRAFIAAFGDREDVLLAVKYHSAHHYPEELKKLHALIVGQRNIRFFGWIFNDLEIASFKSIADCFVSPHRSEGFGLNIAESLLLGKIVIATNYSGNVDFMDEENSYPIAYRLVELGKQLGPYPAEALWAEPDFDDLVDHLRNVVIDRDKADARARQGRRRLLRDNCKETIATRLKLRFDELGIFGTHGRFPLSWKAGVNCTYKYIKQDGPKISVVVPVYDIEPSLLAKCINSVVKQTYENWELILHDDGSKRSDTLAELLKYKGIDARIKVSFGSKNEGIAEATNAAIAFSSGEFIAFLDNDDELAPVALAEMAAAILNNKDVDLLYSDEDKIDFDGSFCDHYFKPDWSPEHLESVMYLLHLIVVRRTTLLAVGGLRARFSGAQDYDLVLRTSRLARRIVHVPKILYHWRKIPGSASAQVDAKPYGLERAAESLQDYLDASGRLATVVPGLLPGLFRVRDTIPAGLPVTLVIFTDNRSAEVIERGKINLFDHFMNSILSKTKTSCDLRFLAVDNGNLTEQQQHMVRQNGGHVVSYDGPRAPFNFSKKANFALQHVKTEIVILLNDDMEVGSSDWVDALVELAKRPATGVVGARLLYPDKRIQHCGIVLGINEHVAHIYHQSPADLIGYNGYTHLIRNYLAVTGACMATRMSLVDEIGGFDEMLAIDYNDIDFCLRAHTAGYRNIYTPFATLYHFEGVTQVRANLMQLSTSSS